MKDFANACRFDGGLDRERFPLPMGARRAGSSLLLGYHSTTNSFMVNLEQHFQLLVVGTLYLFKHPSLLLLQKHQEPLCI